MAAAVYETTSVKMRRKEYIFTLTASRVKFDGFMSVYVRRLRKEEKNQLLAEKLEKGRTGAGEAEGASTLRSRRPITRRPLL